MATYPTVLYTPSGQIAAHVPVPPVTQAARRSLTKEVESRMWSGFMRVLSLMETDDPEYLEGEQVYRKMLTDDAVRAAEFQLRVRILSRPWDIKTPEHLQGDRFGGELAEYAKSVCARLGMDSVLSHLYKGLIRKRAGGQKVYRREGDTFELDRFLPEPRSMFKLNNRQEIYINLGVGLEPANPYKWMVHVNGWDPEYPDGESIFRSIYLPWKLKGTGWQLWTTAMDRFAVPSLVVLFESAESDLTKAAAIADAMNEQLAAVSSGSVGSIANGKSVLQIGGTKAVEGFDTFVEMQDRCIERGILTTTLLINEGKSGADRGNTSVSSTTADRVAQYYGDQISETVTQQLVAPAVLLKYGEAARPYLPEFTIDFEEPIPWERVRDLMDRNFPISKGTIYQNFGAPEPTSEADAFVKDAASGTADTASVMALQSYADTLVLTFPKEDEEEVRSRLFTYMRNREMRTQYQALRDAGMRRSAAIAHLEEEGGYGLSFDTIRDIVTAS